MKRASYRFGVEWIALNDSAGDNHSEHDIATYVSVLLLADLFDVDPARIAAEIIKIRSKGK